MYYSFNIYLLTSVLITSVLISNSKINFSVYKLIYIQLFFIHSHKFKNLYKLLCKLMLAILFFTCYSDCFWVHVSLNPRVNVGEVLNVWVKKSTDEAIKTVNLN